MGRRRTIFARYVIPTSLLLAKPIAPIGSAVTSLSFPLSLSSLSRRTIFACGYKPIALIDILIRFCSSMRSTLTFSIHFHRWKQFCLRALSDRLPANTDFLL